MSENVITDETADRSRDPEASKPGGYTFNAFPRVDYEGPAITIAALRLGDHAHLQVDTGWHNATPEPLRRPNGLSYDPPHRGHAGHLIVHWDAWLPLRDLLATLPGARIAEVERPTSQQLAVHVPPYPGEVDRITGARLEVFGDLLMAWSELAAGDGSDDWVTRDVAARRAAWLTRYDRGVA